MTGMVIGAAGQAQAAPPAPAAAPSPAVDGSAKIRPELKDTLESKGQATFWILLKDKADLAAASANTNWTERGAAVADALRSTAKSSQAGIRAQLDAADVSYQSFWATNAIQVRDGPAALATQLAARPEVAGLYPTRQYELIKPTKGEVEHAINAVEWNIANVNADDVWAQFGTTGEGITVASIDTGTQFDHPALVNQYRGNLGNGSFDHNYNWFDAAGNCASAPCDLNGHGTHTMGTIVGDDGGVNQIGMAPGAKWITANGCCPSDAALIASGEWMLEPTDLNGDNPDASKRPHLVSNSWGSTQPSNDPFMEDVLLAWAASGIYGVWANGNSGALGCGSSGSPGSRIINYSVGAYDINNVIAGFSGRGPGQDGELKPNIAAPGVNVRSSFPGNTYGAINGTSMATPHVAGAIALLWSAAPALLGNIDETRTLLNDTAVDTENLQCGGTADDNNVFGEGRLDALALLEAAPIGDTGTLNGTVTGTDTDDPISGARVTITGGEVSREITTGANGTYSAVLPVGDYAVTVSAFGYVTQTATVTIQTDQTTTQDFALDPAPRVTVSGTITDGSGHGWPLYAKVSVAGAPASVGDYTNPVTGNYSFQIPAGATYTFNVTSQYPGYLDLSETVEVGSGNVVHNMQMTADPATCPTAPGYRFGSDGEFETFDSETLPDGWTIVDHQGSGEVWQFDDPGNRGNLTGGSGGFAIVDSDNYGPGHNQDTSLVSPVVDMSDVAEPVIRFNQDFLRFSGGRSEFTDVDLSIDGGTTWQNVYHQQTMSVRGPRLTTLPVPQAAGEPDVQVRFHYGQATFEFWWQVDNVLIGSTVFCEPVPGGLVVGNVRDLNTGAGVNGATVTSTDRPAERATSFATPDDTGLDDGFYWMFSSLTGSHPFAASAGKYTTQTKTANVAADDATALDFDLAAGRLSVSPTSVSATVRLGGTASRTFTVRNTGTATASIELSERSGDFEILGANGSTRSEQEILDSAGAPVRRVEVDATVAQLAGATAPASLKAVGPAQAGPSAPPWTNIPNLPRTIMDNNLVLVDGQVYSMGGSSGQAGGTAPDVYKFDVAAQAWSRLTNMPSARQQSAEAVIDGQVYLAGGWLTSGATDGSLLIYDPGSDTWTAGASAPGTWSAAGSAVVDGQLYVVGGCTTNACAPYSNRVFRYDPGSNTWDTRANYPENIGWQSCGAVGGLLYCAGGLSNGTPTTNGYVYDPATDAWSPIADMPANLWGSAYVGANDLFLINGGLTGPSTITNQGYSYDPASDTWSSLPASNHTTFRSGSSCGFYKVGGSTVAGFVPSALGEVLPGFEECGQAADVPWLSVSPTTATLQPGQSATITVALDANVAQPGTYTAGVGFKQDTPYSVPPVGVTMNVTPPRDWGKVLGTVRGVACDGTRAPLSGAIVQIVTSDGSVTLTTGADGTYAWWMSSRSNPVNLIVAKDGYQPQTRSVTVRAGRSTVANFDLARIC